MMTKIRGSLCGLFATLTMLSFIFFVVTGMLFGPDRFTPDYYADESNYVELECRLLEAYPSEDYLFLAWEGEEASFVFRGDCKAVAEANGFYAEVETESTVTIVTALAVFGDGWSYPVVSIRQGDRVYLTYEYGLEQLIAASRKDSALAKSFMYPALGAMCLFFALTVLFFVLWRKAENRLELEQKQSLASGAAEETPTIQPTKTDKRRRIRKCLFICFLLMMIYHALLCISFTCNAIETDCIAESYANRDNYEEVLCRMERHRNVCYFQPAEGALSASEQIQLTGENLLIADGNAFQRELKDGATVTVICTLPAFGNRGTAEVVGLRTSEKVYLEFEEGFANLVERERSLLSALQKGSAVLAVLLCGSIVGVILCRPRKASQANAGDPANEIG